MLLASTPSYVGLCLLPNALAALAGSATYWILWRNQYRVTLRMLLVALTAIALVAAIARADIQRQLANPYAFSVFKFWWEEGCAVSAPLWFAASVLFCQFFTDNYGTDA
jgi:hypothetical protein